MKAVYRIDMAEELAKRDEIACRTMYLKVMGGVTATAPYASEPSATRLQ